MQNSPKYQSSLQKFLNLDPQNTSKTIVVAFAVSLFCAVFVAATAVYLRPIQEHNKTLEKQTILVKMVDLFIDKNSVNSQFDKFFQPLLIDLENASFSDKFNPESYDFKKQTDLSLFIPLNSQEDIAKISKLPKYLTIYLVKNENNTVKSVILPVFGYGLWSTMYGFVALDKDLNTIQNIRFYEHAETPGLGGEIDNPLWLSQWPRKQIFLNDAVSIQVAKPSQKKDNPNHINAISGATLTSVGVDNMFRFFFNKQVYGKIIPIISDYISNNS